MHFAQRRYLKQIRLLLQIIALGKACMHGIWLHRRKAQVHLKAIVGIGMGRRFMIMLVMATPVLCMRLFVLARL